MGEYPPTSLDRAEDRAMELLDEGMSILTAADIAGDEHGLDQNKIRILQERLAEAANTGEGE